MGKSKVEVCTAEAQISSNKMYQTGTALMEFFFFGHCKWPNESIPHQKGAEIQE
jgi:hypothetical protein